MSSTVSLKRVDRKEREERTNRRFPPEQQQFLSGSHLSLIHASDLSWFGRVNDSGFEEDESDGGDGAARGFDVSMSPFVVSVEAAGEEGERESEGQLSGEGGE